MHNFENDAVERTSQLIDQHYDRLEIILTHEARLRLGSTHKDVDDLVQETLLALTRYLERASSDNLNIYKLAVTILRNRAAQILNYQKHHPQSGTDTLGILADQILDPVPTILDNLEKRESVELLTRAMEQLSEDAREILKLSYFDQLPVEEIRKRLGLGTVQAVYYRRSAVLKKLAVILTELSNQEQMGGTANE